MTDRVTNVQQPIGAPGLPLFSGFLRIDPSSSLRLYGAEAVRQYRLIAYEEPAARAFLYAANQMLHTEVTPVPGGDTDADKQSAEDLAYAIAPLNPSMGATLRQLYSILWAGWAWHEVQLGRGSDGRPVFASWALRRQESLERWLTLPNSGVVTGLVQRPAPDYAVRTLPIERSIHVTADDSEGSPEGTSSLRGMIRHAYMVRNIEMLLGIALERFGTGLPLFEVDEAIGNRLTDSDTATLQDALDALRQNEYAGGVLPPGVRFRFADSPGLDANTYLEVIRYYRIVMLSTVIADFIALGTQQSGGAYSLGTDKSDLWMLSLNSYQDRVLDGLNEQPIRRLFALPAYRENRFGRITAPPRLTLRPVRRYDLDKLGAFAELLHRIGAFTPTPEDEEFLRSISDLRDLSADQVRAAREAPEPPAPPARTVDSAGDDAEPPPMDEDDEDGEEEEANEPEGADVDEEDEEEDDDDDA